MSYFLMVRHYRHWMVWIRPNGKQAVAETRAEVEEYRREFRNKYPKLVCDVVIASRVAGAVEGE